MNNDSLMQRREHRLAELLQEDDEFRSLVSESDAFNTPATIALLDIIPERSRYSVKSIISYLVLDYLRLRGYRMAGVDSFGVERWVENRFSSAPKPDAERTNKGSNDHQSMVLEVMNTGKSQVRDIAAAAGLAVARTKTVLDALTSDRMVRRSGGRFYVIPGDGETDEGLADGQAVPQFKAVPGESAAGNSRHQRSGTRKFAEWPASDKTRGRLLDSVRSGNTNTAAVAKALGVSKVYARNNLQLLVKEGKLRRVGDGVDTRYLLVSED